MKYESNILNHLTEVYGVNDKKYECEIVEHFIKHGQANYPHLFTYQAEWLAHIEEQGLSSEGYISTYTGKEIFVSRTLSDSVKRAILKGQTTTENNIMSSVQSPSLVLSNSDKSKSSTITFSEDVCLRGNEVVQDTLDCLTGEYVNIIEEREFNGSENWSSNGSSNGVYKYYCNTYTDAKGNATTSIGDKVEFVNVNGGESLKGDVCLTHTTSTGKIQFASTISTTANFKAWLKENPVIVQYERANPVTKTVGVIIKDQNNQVINQLTTFEGGTHISSRSNTLEPIFEVDVIVK